MTRRDVQRLQGKLAIMITSLRSYLCLYTPLIHVPPPPTPRSHLYSSRELASLRKPSKSHKDKRAREEHVTSIVSQVTCVVTLLLLLVVMTVIAVMLLLRLLLPPPLLMLLPLMLRSLSRQRAPRQNTSPKKA